jgi:ABC-type uncharacterized transport system substrate-binding protein
MFLGFPFANQRGLKIVNAGGESQKSIKIVIDSWRRLTVSLFFIGSVLAIKAEARVYQVGLLTQISAERPQIHGLREGLREAGYVEGKNLALQMPLSSSFTQLQSVARSYKQAKVDVIVTTGGVETSVAKDIAQEIPTVFMPVIDPVESGFVKSLSHPGTNMTGLSFTGDLREHGKQLEIFKEIMPNLRQLNVLYDDRHPAAVVSLRKIRTVAAYLKIRLSEKPVDSMIAAERVVSLLPESKFRGIYLLCSSLFADPTKPAEMAKKRKIPFHSCTSDQVTNGAALFAYARDFYAIGHRGAWYVDRILKGARAEDLPVEVPTRFELVINLKVAHEIGLTIPPEVLQRADKVIR